MIGICGAALRYSVDSKVADPIANRYKDKKRHRHIVYAFQYKHLFALFGGHAHALEHGKLLLAGKNVGHSGVDEIQDTDQKNHGAQRKANERKLLVIVFHLRNIIGAGTKIHFGIIHKQ